MRQAAWCAGVLSVCAEVVGAVPVFIFAGQSNMSGSGGATPAGCVFPEPLVPFAYYLETQGGSVIHEDSWGPLRPLTVAGGDPINAFGPELAFVCRVLETLPDGPEASRALVVKSTANGSALEKYWLPGRPRMLFEKTVGKVEDELALIGEDWEIAAFIWVQGEDDALRGDFASHYGANMHTFVDALRIALDAPALPVIHSQLSPEAVMEFTGLVRVGKAAFSAADGHDALVEVADLELRDGVHYTTAARNELGRRLAEAYLRLACPGDVNADGMVDSADLGLLLNEFGGPPGIADVNDDGAVDSADLGILLSAFGGACVY